MKKILLLTGMLCSLLLVACVTNEETTDPESGGDKTRLTLKYSVEESEGDMMTRQGVETMEGETTVNDIVLLFFDKSADQSGVFKDYIVVKPQEDQVLKMNDQIPVSFDDKALDANTGYNILAIANLSGKNYLADNKELEDFGGSWLGMTEKAVTEKALADAKGANDNSNAILPNALLMSGTSSLQKGGNAIDITFVRNVARFDIALADALKKGGETYELVSASIWNAYKQAAIFGNSLDYSEKTARITRFYGITNNDPAADITGGLYVFENNVANPVQNDKFTTCLIIGLQKNGEQKPAYYRVNMNAQNSEQRLVRNNVYTLTINSVNGPGKETETEAYSGIKPELTYSVNNWELDDNGLVVQDENSVLSVPVKTIKLKAEGESNEYSIYTFTTLTTKPVLSFKETYSVQDKISARLEGNTLIVEAEPLTPGEDDRTGMITIHYAGLTATMSVLQSSTADLYLTVDKPKGGIPTFNSTGGAGSGYLNVNASGPWTATLYMKGFSFEKGDPDKLTIKQSEVIDNKFQVWTTSDNPKPSERHAVVIVTLDAAPNNYSAAIVFTQSGSSDIMVGDGVKTIVFNSNGTPVGKNIVNVFPGYTKKDDGSYDINEWECELLDYDNSTNSGRDAFEATDAHVTESDNPNEPGNTITVTAIGANNTNSQITALLRIKHKGDAAGKSVDIKLVQMAGKIDIVPEKQMQVIPVTGGVSEILHVEGDADLKYLLSVSVVSGISKDGRSIVNHQATLVDVDENPLAAGPYDTTTKFRVKMPKVYWPNREIPDINAVVTVKIVDDAGKETGVTATELRVKQESLISRGIKAWDVKTSGWGSLLYGSYFTRFRSFLGNKSYFPDYEAETGTTFPEGTTYVHVSVSSVKTINWEEVERFRKDYDGITFILGDLDNDLNVEYLNKGTLAACGYKVTRGGKGDGFPAAKVKNDYSGKLPRVYQYLMQQGEYVAKPEPNKQGVIQLYMNQIRAEVVDYPESGVVVVENSTSGNPLIIIDPKEKLIYESDCELFDWPYYYLYKDTYGHGYGFMCNLIYYLANAARYGSHFTDLLRDDLTDGPAAPWDAKVWGDNVWKPSTRQPEDFRRIEL